MLHLYCMTVSVSCSSDVVGCSRTRDWPDVESLTNEVWLQSVPVVGALVLQAPLRIQNTPRPTGAPRGAKPMLRYIGQGKTSIFVIYTASTSMLMSSYWHIQIQS